MKRFTVDGKPVGVVRLGDHVTAFVPFCPHARADLTHARYEGETVSCHWHGWSFNLISGEGINNDARLKLFPVLIENGDVYIHEVDEAQNQVDDGEFMPEIRWKDEGEG